MSASVFSASARAVSEHKRLAVKLFLVELVTSLAVAVAVGLTLSAVASHRPLLDQVVNGDLTATSHFLSEHAEVVLTLFFAGVAVALLYGILSWYLGAGMLGVFHGQPFGESAARHFLPFLKLFLWSLVPVLLGLTAVTVGIALALDYAEKTMTVGAFLRHGALVMAPGVIVLSLVFCAVDFARVLLVTGERTSSLKALFGGLRVLYRQPLAMAHYGCYLGLWALAGLGYLLVTVGRDYPGLGGAVTLFVLRQMYLFFRFVLRFATSAGQVTLVTGGLAPRRDTFAA